MGSVNVLASIGMAFFFIKFYIYIGIQYAFNFLKHKFEKCIHGNSKTVVCPYKSTHQDVFLTIGNYLFTQINSSNLKDLQSKIMNSKHLMALMFHFGEYEPRMIKLCLKNTQFSSYMAFWIVPFHGFFILTSNDKLT
jgi:hypothetical protein